MRNLIQEKLLEIDSNIHYGIVPDNVENKEWNYFVFGQRKLRKKDSTSNDLQGYWNVVIVRENFIPDDVVIDVINKITDIPGVRLADGDFEYNYIMKGNTNIVVEILELQFTKTKKGC